jgi:hypothetical protein
MNLFSQLVWLLGWGISPTQGLYLHTGQHMHRKNADTHPCLEWDSSPRSQCSNGRRQYVPHTARPLGSAVKEHWPIKLIITFLRRVIYSLHRTVAVLHVFEFSFVTSGI